MPLEGLRVKTSGHVHIAWQGPNLCKEVLFQQVPGIVPGMVIFEVILLLAALHQTLYFQTVVSTLHLALLVAALRSESKGMPHVQSPVQAPAGALIGHSSEFKVLPRRNGQH